MRRSARSRLADGSPVPAGRRKLGPSGHRLDSGQAGGPDLRNTDDPRQAAGCGDCLELLAEDVQDHTVYRGHCLHCRQEIIAQVGVEWRPMVRRPCPHCGAKEW